MRLTRLPEELQALEAASVLEPIDVHFAATLGELAGEERVPVLLAAALVSRRARDGHVCVPLAEVAGTPIASGDADASPTPPSSWPELEAWREAITASPLVSVGGGRRPLVLDGVGRLYLQRYHEHEQRLAALLRDRRGLEAVLADPSFVQGALTRLFGTPSDAPLDDQQTAVLVALVQRFAIISGGPGTGKTSTVARLLALLVELSLEQEQEPPRILLLAPTGKAAGRLVESIRLAKARLDTRPEVLAAVPEEARTIHRALGVRRGGNGYWHDASRPLLADLVLVDEASMVDLAVMRHLVEAVPPHARLILLGDRHQLASVEAGSVLGELCAAAETPRKEAGRTAGGAEPAYGAEPGYGLDLCAAVAALSGKELRTAGAQTAPLRDHVVELTKSYRFDADSFIGQLAAAVRQGDPARVLRLLERGSAQDEVSWLAESPAQELSPTMTTRVVEGFRPMLEASDAAAALAALSRFRVLCAHRRGWAGVEHLNEKIRGALLRARLVSGRAELFQGRPVLVTRNDYSVGLFNGDVGLAWGDTGAVRVHFEGTPSPDGALETRPVSPARLPAHETAFAMSVHKSQGSEHDEVLIVLPEAGSPLLTRELLYTAITRAKTRVCLVGSREAVEEAVRRRVARASGLADALTP